MSEAQASPRWVAAADLAAFEDRKTLAVSVGGSRIALVRLADGIFAIGDTCPHMQASLSGGTVVGDHIECPAHYALFEIRTGKATGGLACRDLRTWPVRVDGTTVLVCV